MKKLICIFLTVICLVTLLSACNNGDTKSSEIQTIKFSQGVDDLKQYTDKKVKINGFMSTLSPLDGSLIYLLNLPLQSCPFCVANTTTLSNTIAVCGKNIEYTSKPVCITGTLKFGDFTDSYGYQYGYRIEDADITVLNESEISEKMKVYYTVSQDDLLGKAYNVMLNMDTVANFESYRYDKTEFDTYGELPFDDYQKIIDTITSVNTNGDYDSFLKLVNDVESLRCQVNEAIAKKDYSKYKTFQEPVNDLFNQFNAFISKYEF